ncbi:MAG: hypothetical protein KAT39_04790 [Alphaproteobacteria bacterium]|nr:hypothetical protein [Alphaproteobacteria bacterium]
MQFVVLKGHHRLFDCAASDDRRKKSEEEDCHISVSLSFHFVAGAPLNVTSAENTFGSRFRFYSRYEPLSGPDGADPDASGTTKQADELEDRGWFTPAAVPAQDKRVREVPGAAAHRVAWGIVQDAARKRRRVPVRITR